MPEQRDQSYYARRAVEERERAQTARDPIAINAHRDLAREYERRAGSVDCPAENGREQLVNR